MTSRRLNDRGLGRAIEDAWSHENRSPSRMMQELASAFRPAGLNIFRQRRNMLFVSPIRSRPFSHELTGVSQSIGGILAAIAGTPGINRHDLAEKVVAGGAENGDAERLKLTLASDLKWLISEGYVIEFNDGSLDLPRAKAAAPTPSEATAEKQPSTGERNESGTDHHIVAAAISAAEVGNTVVPNESNAEHISEAAVAQPVLSPSSEPAAESNEPGA